MQPQPMITEFYECDCSSDEHTLKFTLDPDDGMLWTSVFLSQYRGFFGRCWEALKYVFGYRSKYGHFDCVHVREDDKPRLIALLQKSIECRQRHDAKNKGEKTPAEMGADYAHAGTEGNPFPPGSDGYNEFERGYRENRGL